MKSAMQELIEWLKFYDNEPIKPIILKAQIQSLLEKEKENIVTSWNDGKVSMMSGEQYFNETFDNMQNGYMMTPKEKAEELIKKYSNLTITSHIVYFAQVEHFAKQCALIAVDEVMQKTLWDKGEQKYWQEVKQEIENL